MCIKWRENEALLALMSDEHTINQNIVLEKESGVERDNILLIPLPLVFYYRQQRIDSHNILIIPQ